VVSHSGTQPVNFRVMASGSAASSDSASLVEAACQGHRAAFGQLYARYAAMVHGILLARVPYSEVEDLVQDAFLKAWPRLHTLRDPHCFGAWMATIARNLAKDYYREPRLAAALQPESMQLASERQATSGDRAAEAHAILSVVRSLPEAYRETLILRLVEGMTGPEIAARTGLTEGSVRVNLHRGMQQLRAKLEASRVAHTKLEEAKPLGPAKSGRG
jgi:RNA polymerase sigma-70 factor, ECF subfamily